MSALSPTDFNHRGDLLPPGASARPAPIHPPIQTPLTPTPPAQPTLLSKPTGPPVPALAKIGFWGSINDFNQSLQTAHNAYLAANGVPPSKATILHLALQQADQARNPEQLSKLPPIGDKGHDAFLGQMKSITQGAYDPAANQQRHQDFNDFMHQHADVLQDMLNDPKTHAKTLAAINEAEDNLDFHGINGPGLSFGGAVKAFTTVPATWIGKTGFALGKDVDKLGLRAASVEQNPSGENIHSLKVAATFPNLTRAAPAIAQVVKGLIYSPASLAVSAFAVERDIADATNWAQSGGKHGSPEFKRTQKLVKDYGLTLWQDLNNPGGRAGYVMLDVFGLLSAGTGTFVRLGRAGEAFSAAETGSRISSAVKAAARPHSLQTVEYSKGGYTENISIASAPFQGWVQRKIPFIGADAQMRQLADPLHDPFSWLRETKIGNDFTYERGGVSQAMADALSAVNPTSPEARMGRAGNISRATEEKFLAANIRQVEDVAGWSVRKTALDAMIPDSWFEGLTRGENKALQVAALDYAGDLGNKISAWEKTHQFLIENRIGNPDAHRQQLAELALARKTAENPSDRFLRALQILRDTSTEAEQLRIAWGMPEQAAMTGLMKPGLFVQYANEAADLHERIQKEFDSTQAPMKPQTKEMELRLHNLKSFMGKLDVRYIPEGYKVPDFVPSKKLSDKTKELTEKSKSLQKTKEAESEWIQKNREKIAAAKAGKGREVLLDNPHRATINRLSEVVETLESEIKTRTGREQAVHARRHPAEGLPEGYYAKIGNDFVPVNRQSDDSFYVPTLLRGGKEPQVPRGNVRLPGSIYGIGPTAGPIWNDYQMTGAAMMDGDFRSDTPHLIGQSFASTARAIPRFESFSKAWAASHEINESHPKIDGEIYIRDVNEVSTEIRKAFQSLREGHITQEEAEGLPADLMDHLYPKAPKPGEHVRAINAQMLGDIFFGPKDRTIAQMEPGVRMFMSPINNTLRPLVLYISPKYALNIGGNGLMMVFDQGAFRAGVNFAGAMSMKDWAIGNDYTKFLNLMGAGKASSYMSGELGTKLGTISQGLADFWSKASDQNFRLASGLHYAKIAINENPDKFAGETFAEKFSDLINNPEHKTLRNDAVKRGNDAMVAFDRMSPIEKALFRHILFVYPWQRGALIWSFRSLFEHPMKSALLATLGQEEYTDDTWLKEAPEWVRRTGYIPYHWVGDHVDVLNPTSISTFSTLGDVLGTAKGLIEGDQYARFSDLFGPAGQFLAHAFSGTDSFGNPYKGSQLLGAIEDTLNMVPLFSAKKRADKGSGKALREYDPSAQGGLANVLSSALKATALDPGWLGGWGVALAGGFSGRELNLTATAARYWIKAPPKERHQHEVDLIMRQLALQSQYLETGKVPSHAEVMQMIMAPLHSVQVKGRVPEDVRQAVLDAGQISYHAALMSGDNTVRAELQKEGLEPTSGLGRTLTDKERLVVSINYYKQAGRMDEAAAKALIAQAKPLESAADIKTLAAQVALKYGHLAALHEWDKRVRLQYSFMNPDTGAANFAQRIDILYTNGLAPQKLYNLSQDERGQYGHLYTQYITARDALRAKLRSDTSLTPTQKALQLSEFDSTHDKPVKIGSRTLPSLAALGSAANWDSSTTAPGTEASQKRLNMLVSKNWYHLNSAEKAMFGRKVDPKVATGWDKYWTFLKDARDKGGVIDSSYRQTLAAYVNRYYAPGFLQDYLYASKTPKIDRFLQTKIYQSMPERGTFDQIATYAKTYGKAMADGTSSISDTRKLWKAYVNQSLIPWLQKDHPDLYAWIEPLGTSWLTSMINTG